MPLTAFAGSVSSNAILAGGRSNAALTIRAGAISSLCPSRGPRMKVMSEFMGLLYGVYDAKPQVFVLGGMSLHNALVPHGPDAEAFERASTRELEPEKLSGTMAFMFETRYPLCPTAYASKLELLDGRYPDAWDGLRKMFTPG